MSLNVTVVKRIVEVCKFYDYRLKWLTLTAEA